MSFAKHSNNLLYYFWTVFKFSYVNKLPFFHKYIDFQNDKCIGFEGVGLLTKLIIFRLPPFTQILYCFS